MQLPLNTPALDAHKQLYSVSCIPMTVELVLKQLGRVAVDFYDLQHEWKNKSNGSFGEFDGRTIEGVTFHARFCQTRGKQFPLNELFNAIEAELGAGRYVIVSLAVAGGWHMHVIYAQESDGDFLAVTKNGFGQTEYIESVKRVITEMGGTDILVYNLP